MGMKLKMDGDKAVVQDGKPVYIDDDGKEVAFDAPGTLENVRKINAEARDHRLAKEAAEAKLKAFEGIEDPDAARKAMETVKSLDQGQLLTVGKVEELKAGLKKANDEALAALNAKYEKDVGAATKRASELETQLYGEKIGNAFGQSKFLKDKTILPPDAAIKMFGERFKVEDGKIVAYDASGTKLFSRSKGGVEAEVDEALEILMDGYPYKENFLKGTGGGGGARGGNGGGGGDKKLTRQQFDSLSHGERAAKMKEGYAVVDA